MPRDKHQGDIGRLEVHIEYTRKAVDEIRAEVKAMRNMQGRLRDDLKDEFDKRYVGNDRMEKAEEIIKPFVKLRNKIWTMALGLVIISSITTSIGVEYIKERFLP